MNADSLDTYWQYFDKFYCISITERTDRRDHAKAQFKKVGLADRVEFVIVQKHPHNCEEGIYNSHLACIKKGSRPEPAISSYLKMIFYSIASARPVLKTV
jgi:hypothetical protein